LASEAEQAAQSRGERPDKLELAIPPGPRLGDVVVEAENLTKLYGDRVIIDGATFSLPPGAIVGVVGPNGAGKTTTLRLITGSEQPDDGRITIGSTVVTGYADQSRAVLDPELTVFQQISGGLDEMVVGNRTIHARAYVASFGFKGSDQEKKVGQLSGGERNRVMLAKVLTQGANLLLLDEPTNDLDVDTLRSLEEALIEFPGCAVVVSHDRWFLDRVSTHTMAFEDESQVKWYDGTWSEYEADRRKRLGADADQPHRVKYKPLVR